MTQLFGSSGWVLNIALCWSKFVGVLGHQRIPRLHVATNAHHQVYFYRVYVRTRHSRDALNGAHLPLKRILIENCGKCKLCLVTPEKRMLVQDPPLKNDYLSPLRPK